MTSNLKSSNEFIDKKIFNHIIQTGIFQNLPELLKSIKVDYTNKYAIHEAIQNGHFEVVKILVNDGRFPLNEKGEYALISAFECNQFQILEFLWDKGGKHKEEVKSYDIEKYNSIESIINKFKIQKSVKTF